MKKGAQNHSPLICEKLDSFLQISHRSLIHPIFEIYLSKLFHAHLCRKWWFAHVLMVAYLSHVRRHLLTFSWWISWILNSVPYRISLGICKHILLINARWNSKMVQYHSGNLIWFERKRRRRHEKAVRWFWIAKCARWNTVEDKEGVNCSRILFHIRIYTQPINFSLFQKEAGIRKTRVCTFFKKLQTFWLYDYHS